MCACTDDCTRRTFLCVAAAALLAAPLRVHAANEGSDEHRAFIVEALRMREDAVRAGDQPYGAVVVKDSRVVGYGPSRVLLRGEWIGHAEREAMRDAQARLGTQDLSGCVLFSTSRPCGVCEPVAARNNIARMIYGAQATDAGRPRA